MLQSEINSSRWLKYIFAILVLQLVAMDRRDTNESKISEVFNQDIFEGLMDKTIQTLFKELYRTSETWSSCIQDFWS